MLKKKKSNKLLYSVVLIILVSTLLRLYLFIGAGYIVDGDESLVGIQAKHYTQLKTLHPFVYGQDYMGSLQSITAAFVFLITGVSFVSLKMVPLFYYILFLIIYYIFALKNFNKNIAVFSLLILAFPGLTLNKWTLMPTGGHIENLFLSILLSYFAYNIIYNDTYKKSHLYIFSFLTGLAFWTHPFSIFLILVYTIFIFIKIKPSIKLFSINLLFFIVGSLPLWIYNVFNRFITFLRLGAFFLGIRGSSVESLSLWMMIKSIFSKFFSVFTNFFDTMRMVFSIFGFNYNLFFEIVFGVLFLSSIIVFFYYIIKNKKYSHKLFPLLIFFIIYYFIMSSSSRAIRDRYLLPLYLVFPLVFSSFLEKYLLKYLKFNFCIQIIIFFYVLINIQSTILYTHKNYENVAQMFESRINVINFLVFNNIKYAYSGHYTAFPLSFLSDERVIISPKAGFYNEDRITYYSNLVDNTDEDKAVIFNLAIPNNNLPRNAFETALLRKNISYEVHEINPYIIFYNFSENILIDDFNLPVRFR